MKKSLIVLKSIGMLLLINPHVYSAEYQIPNNQNWARQVNSLRNGDVALLSAGTYPGGKSITVSGVTIRGAGERRTVIMSNGGNVLNFERCSNTTLENVVISTGVPNGFASNFLDPFGGTYQYPKNDKTKREGRNGIVLDRTRNCTFRKIIFKDVWTRGVLAGGDGRNYNSGTLVENCLFYRVGQDTSSGDINFNYCHTFAIRNNVFAGNVDGVVFQGAGGGGVIENNVFLLGLSENGIDIKDVYKKFSESPETHIRNNVLYTDKSRFSSLDLNIKSNGIRVYYNKFMGNRKGEVIYFRGRGELHDLVVAGNWILGGNRTTAIRVDHDSSFGRNSRVYDSYVYHNVIQNVSRVLKADWLVNNPNFNFNNNICLNSGKAVGSYLDRVTAKNNLFSNASPWGSGAIQGNPVFINGQIGPIAPQSAGIGRAFIDSNHNFGKNVGIPERMYNKPAPNFDTLEKDILGGIASQLSIVEVREAYQTARRSMPSITLSGSGGNGGGSGSNPGTPVNVAPVVILTSPANGVALTAPASVVVEANALDQDGSISKVQFYSGSSLINTDSTSPYRFTWSNVVPGTYSLTAKATDNKGAVSTSSGVRVVVNARNAVPDVTLTSPSRGTTLTAPASIILEANASDSDGTISKVQFFDGNQFLKSDGGAPFILSLTDMSVGSHSLTAKAFDNDGATTISSPVNITVRQNAPPSIRITSPKNGETLVGTTQAFPISVNTSDAEGSVKGVAFYLDGKWLGHKSASPFTHYMRDVINTIGEGDHQLMAVAIDDQGARGESEIISFSLRRPRVLFVSGERDILRSVDEAAKKRLESLGFEVAVVRSKSVQLSDASGKELIVISSDLMSDDMAADFKLINVPIFTWEAFLLDNLGMTGMVSQNDFGMIEANQTGLVTKSNYGDLNAGLSGRVNLYAQNGKMYYGVPNSNAHNIVTLGDGTTRSLMFVYEKGVRMPGLKAPSRRVFFYLCELDTPGLTDQTWKLFDAGIHWASGF